MNTQKLILVLTGALMMVTFAACGAAKEADAPRVSAVTDAMIAPINFRLEALTERELRLDEAQLFLWKPGYTRDDVAFMLGQSSELDQLKSNAFIWNKQALELKKTVQEIGVDVSTVDDDEKELSKKASKVAKLLEPVQAIFNKPAGETSEKDFEKVFKPYAREYEKFVTLEAKLNEEMNLLRVAHLDDEYENWKKIRSDLEKNQENVTTTMQVIDSRVSLFSSSPIRFNFEVKENQPLRLKISGWDLSKINDESVAETIFPIKVEEETLPHDEFSTEFRTLRNITQLPAIRNLTYSSHGGIFTFEVYTPKAVYYFKISRTKYAAEDLRIYYKGDIVRCAVVPAPNQARSYALPTLLYVSDYVKCGMTTEGVDVRGVRPEEFGVVYERRGVANLVNRSDKQE